MHIVPPWHILEGIVGDLGKCMLGLQSRDICTARISSLPWLPGRKICSIGCGSRHEFQSLSLLSPWYVLSLDTSPLEQHVRQLPRRFLRKHVRADSVL